MVKQILNYGETTIASYVTPHPSERGEYVAEMREGVVEGFSHPNLRRRDFGWRGSILVKFPDGRRVWSSY